MVDTRRDLDSFQNASTGLFKDNTAGDISANDLRDFVESGHGESLIQADTEANTPASGQLAGDLFFPTNGVYVKRYGSAWVPWGPIYPLVEPIDGDFSWINQGTASVVSTQGGISLIGPVATTENLRCRVKTAPSTPYTITAAVNIDMGITTAHATGVGWAGLCFRQTSTSEISTWGILTTGGDMYAGHDKWDSPTSLNSAYFETKNNTAGLGSVLWLRIEDDGANRKVHRSTDGQNWTEWDSVGRTDFLTADQVGFFVNPRTIPICMTLLSWEEA